VSVVMLDSRADPTRHEGPGKQAGAHAMVQEVEMSDKDTTRRRAMPETDGSRENARTRRKLLIDSRDRRDTRCPPKRTACTSALIFTLSSQPPR
jgi:hypothetical protein